MKPLQDKVALVTGAAGTMGLAVVKALLEDGCKVAMVDVSHERNRALADELGRAPCRSRLTSATPTP
jgi:3-oxoacyl-[acyl-carrier protein] reductase